jgi:hypothetical protein
LSDSVIRIEKVLPCLWRIGRDRYFPYNPFKKIKECVFMTNNFVQAAIHERVDPVLEAIIQGLIETGSRPSMPERAGDVVSDAMTEALMIALMTSSSARATSQSSIAQQVSPFGSALASALAAALAPALAESLTPAIVSALSDMASAEKTGQGKTGQEKPDQGRTGQEKPSQEKIGQEKPSSKG